MKFFKTYGWAMKIIGAALLVALALFLQFGDGREIVTPFVGALIILYSVIRLWPFVKTQSNDLIKTINIIEITIDFAIGLAFILIPILTEVELGNAFGYMLGVHLMLRGAVHFYSVSASNEQSDLPKYFFHIAALIVGSLVFFSGDFDVEVLIYLILFFSVTVGGYLVFDGYKGYKVYRYQTQAMMPDSDSKEEPTSPNVEKRVPEEEDRPHDSIVS